ncbi:hypothetical protein [Pseudomonas sp.]|uniref:hypothetical protein n=1 Tax=Pseudomonas sp. TaxID=306 RepID=UPI0028A9B226|nr:hypothetical protein [Pseudomonas sp.]
MLSSARSISPQRGLSALALALAAMGSWSYPYAAVLPNVDAGLITLTGKKGDVESAENDSNASCTIDVPAAGAGRSIDVHLNNPGSPCYELRVSSIAMSNMPPATRVLLTDDYLCDTTLGNSFDVRRDPESNKNFWVKLRTGAAGATLVEESISALTFKGFATNRSPTSGAVSQDVQVEDFGLNGGNERMTYTLSCIRITSSTNKGTIRGTYLSFPEPEWGEPFKESESEDWSCPTNSVVAGRKHSGDENGETAYQCASISKLTSSDGTWSAAFPECGINLDADYDNDQGRFKTCAEKKYDNENAGYLYFTCPANQVMLGRSHKGDENGDTQYRCGALYQGEPEDGKRVSVWPGTWSEAIKEADSEHSCPANQVMVGRAHKGDENNDTRYLCAKLRAPVDAPI